MLQEKNSQRADTFVRVTDAELYPLYGYDKPLRSSQESMFVSNRSADTVRSLQIETEYFDMQNRQIHKRTLEVEAVVPPGETRQVNFRSWDRQQSYYYFESTRPKRATATPYKVRCRVVGVKKSLQK